MYLFEKVENVYLLNTFEMFINENNHNSIYLPEEGAPLMMMPSPRLFLAALPSVDRSIPRCLAMAADTGVISSSPTPTVLVESTAFTVN